MNEESTLKQNILLSNINTKELIDIWNQMCDSNYSVLRIKAHIKYMNTIESMVLSEFLENIDQDNFNFNDKYYAFNKNNKIVSFSELNDFELFDFNTLYNYILSVNNNDK